MASLMEDRKKEKLRAQQEREEQSRREKEELEKAIEESANTFLMYVQSH